MTDWFLCLRCHVEHVDGDAHQCGVPSIYDISYPTWPVIAIGDWRWIFRGGGE